MCSCQEIYAFKYARKDRLQSYRCKLNIALKTEIITKQKANGIDGKWNTFQVSDLKTSLVFYFPVSCCLDYNFPILRLIYIPRFLRILESVPQCNDKF